MIRGLKAYLPVILIIAAISLGFNLNLILAYVDLETAKDRPELLVLFNQGYTEVCLDDFYFSKKLTSCIMNPDYYLFEETDTSYNIHNTKDVANFGEGTHCAYYITIVANMDNNVTYGCPFSWGNDWNKIQYKMDYIKVDGYDQKFLHIQSKYLESKLRLMGIADRNPDTMRFR